MTIPSGTLTSTLTHPRNVSNINNHSQFPSVSHFHAASQETRPRTRTRGHEGGLEAFQWESLKSQSGKERSHYLGVSSKLGNSGLTKIAGKKTAQSAETRAQEKKAAKELEAKLMQQALGGELANEDVLGKKRKREDLVKKEDKR